MGKKLPNTPKSRIKASLRQLWLRSRERAAALRRDNYSCQKCGVKQSKKKGFEVSVEVHHKGGGIENWDEIYRVIQEFLLCDVEKLETLCKSCHDKITRGVS